MPFVSLRGIVAETGLIVVTGEQLLDRPVQWAHVSELTDPAPYLLGGELLLTAGVDLPADGERLDRYVRGLIDADVAALGFGLAPVHREIPPGLTRACGEHGLPLLAVPEHTPFLAVSRSVARAWEELRVEQMRALAEAQSRVTSAALEARRPLGAVVAATAEVLDGWALLISASGRTIARSPCAPEPDTDTIALARRLARAAGPRAASTHTSGGQVDLHPVGGGSAVLLVGRARPFTAPDRAVTAVCVGLLGLLTRSARSDDSQGRLLTRLLLGDGLGTDDTPPTPAAALLAVLLGRTPGEPVRVLRAIRPEGQPDPEEATAAARALSSPILDINGTQLRAVVSADTDEEALATLRDSTGALGVLSRPVHPADLPTADREARDLLPRAVAASVPLVARPSGPGVGALVERGTAGSWARTVLGPLLAAEDGEELCTLLRAWLAHHGGWESTAAATGLHRNSVRQRLARVQRLLDTDLADAGERARLWLALDWL